MPITRQTKSNLEIQGEQAITTNDMETKEANFKSLVKKLAYFNRSTREALGYGSDKINRHKAYDLIQVIQGTI